MRDQYVQDRRRALLASYRGSIRTGILDRPAGWLRGGPSAAFSRRERERPQQRDPRDPSRLRRGCTGQRQRALTGLGEVSFVSVSTSLDRKKGKVVMMTSFKTALAVAA